ncbi:MAG: hypothetical protein WDW38_006358 [Sanguina aurantia]
MSDTCYRALVKLDGRLFGGMTRETFSMTTMRGRQLFEFTDTASNISGTLEYPDFTVKVGGAIVGVLADDCMVRCSKQTHVSIDDQAEYRCSRIMGEDTDKLTLVKIGPGASTTIDLPMMDFTRNDSAVITHQGKQSSIGNTKAATLRSSLEKQVYKHIEKRLGLAPGSAAAAFTFHIGIVNIFGCEDPEQVRTTEYDLVAALLTAKPEIKEMFKFAPDAKIHNSVVEKYLVDAFLHGTTLSTADERFVKTQRSGGELRKLLVREVVDAGFEASLDANLDLFAVSNGVFWLRDGMVQGFRPITTDDRVCTTAEWSYSAAEGQAKRGEVDTFLTQVFPVEAERRVVLSYVAHLMSGRRSVKKFLVLTDKRAGNNGKSTFAKLVMRFFGPLSKSSTKFVCRGSFDKDRDSHDGGLECFKGKRLLVAEELKHTMTLDEAMLKSYAGGGATLVEGRKMGSSENFKFMWQAGFILIFNEGDCPSFDTGDQAFMGRMVVAPMRSKFVADLGEEPEPFTYRMDLVIETKFEAWLSALADVLMEYQDKSVLLNVPASMSEWRQDVMVGANPLAEWLMERVEVTKDQSDRIVMKELRKLYVSESKAPNNAFPKLARAFLEALDGVVYKQNDRVGGVLSSSVMRGRGSSREQQQQQQQQQQQRQQHAGHQ